MAFVRGGNLHVVEIGRRPVERALTRDGSADVLNGILDWVYQEEIYGRGRFKGYWWSPDSRRLALLQLQEARVPRYPLVDDIAAAPRAEDTRYPKAGDPNPEVAARDRGGLGERPALGGPLALRGGGAADRRRHLEPGQPARRLPGAGPRPDLALPRDADAATLRRRTLLREKTKAWVDRQDDAPHLAGRRRVPVGFRAHGMEAPLPLSRRRHAGRARHARRVGSAHRARRGRGRRLGVFLGHRAQPDRRATSTGSASTAPPCERLSRTEGTHTASFNPARALYLDTWSDVTTPPQVRLHRADGSEVRVVDPNPAPALAEYRLGRPELLRVPTRDGFPMEAMLLRPPDFDPREALSRLPARLRRAALAAWSRTPGEAPRTSSTSSWPSAGSWSGCATTARPAARARSPPGRCTGTSGSWSYATWRTGWTGCARQGWADPDRIGINGWSGGGYLVTYALTHSRRFAMGIAGGPVTDWHNYDSVFTERYMDLPSRNAEGYRRSSPRNFAADLHGRLLLLHGAIDDNVHPQNTMQFAYELQKAQLPFEMMLYPRSRHGVAEPALLAHLSALKLAFVEKVLLSRPSSPASSPSSLPSSTP